MAIDPNTRGPTTSPETPARRTTPSTHPNRDQSSRWDRAQLSLSDILGERPSWSKPERATRSTLSSQQQRLRWAPGRGRIRGRARAWVAALHRQQQARARLAAELLRRHQPTLFPHRGRETQRAAKPVRARSRAQNGGPRERIGLRLRRPIATDSGADPSEARGGSLLPRRPRTAGHPRTSTSATPGIAPPTPGTKSSQRRYWSVTERPCTPTDPFRCFSS